LTLSQDEAKRGEGGDEERKRRENLLWGLMQGGAAHFFLPEKAGPQLHRRRKRKGSGPRGGKGKILCPFISRGEATVSFIISSPQKERGCRNVAA